MTPRIWTALVLLLFIQQSESVKKSDPLSLPDWKHLEADIKGAQLLQNVGNGHKKLSEERKLDVALKLLSDAALSNNGESIFDQGQ